MVQPKRDPCACFLLIQLPRSRSNIAAGQQHSARDCMIGGFAIIVLLVTGSYFLWLWERDHKNPDWKKLAWFLLTLAALLHSPQSPARRR